MAQNISRLPRLNTLQQLRQLPANDAIAKVIDEPLQQGYQINQFYMTKANRERLARYDEERSQFESYVRAVFYAKHGIFQSQAKCNKLWKKFIAKNPVFVAEQKRLEAMFVQIYNAIQREHTIETNKKSA